MPLLAERVDNALLVDGRSAGGADGQVELLVAFEAVEVAASLASARVQLDATCGAVEVVRMVDFALEANRVVLDGLPLNIETF